MTGPIGTPALLLEILAKLPGPRRPEAGVVSRPEWNRLNGVENLLR